MGSFLQRIENMEAQAGRLLAFVKVSVAVR